MSKGRQKERAAEYFKRAPNYSGEAIVALSGLDLGPEDARTKQYVNAIIAVLRSSHKFTVPNDGAIFDLAVTQEMIESVRLPFASIVVEYDSSPREALSDGDVYSPKRIAMAHEVVRYGTAGILVMSCSFFPEDGPPPNGWVPHPCGLFFPTEKTGLFELHGAEVIPMGEAADRIISKIGRKAAAELAFRDYISETRAIFQLCAALACTNVSTEVVRPNREARESRPASPLFDYHVLMIQPGAERHPSEDRGGSHASPRTHLRRGHIRRLSTGPRIWVNSCVVSPGAIGTVNKDYAIGKAKRPVRGANPEGPFARRKKGSGMSNPGHADPNVAPTASASCASNAPAPPEPTGSASHDGAATAPPTERAGDSPAERAPESPVQSKWNCRGCGR